MDSVENHQPPTMQQILAKKYAEEADGANRRPIYHSLLFWCCVALVVAAISLYAFTDTLAFLPRID